MGKTQSSLSEINMVPFIDVVLVLLIHFMITAPILQSGIEVDVPKTKTVKEITEPRLVISVDKNQLIYLGNSPVNIHDLGAKGAGATEETAGCGVSALRRKGSVRGVRFGNRHAAASRH
jgi:biopolymer transport protein ExbD